MKTKIYFFAVIFITSIMSSFGLYATQTHIPGDQLTPDSWHIFCGNENDSIIAHKPENAMTTMYFSYEVTLEIFWDTDSIIITMETMGLWSFYSEETGSFFFSVYIVSEPPTQPTCMAEPISKCMVDFSELFDAENESPGTTYIWSTGATTHTIMVYTPGIYAVTITNACGEGIYDVAITYDNPNTPQLGADQNICLGDSITLIGTISNPDSYLWSTGETSPTINVDASGDYWVYAEDVNGCNGRDTINITIIQTPSQEILLATINTDPLDPNYGNNMITWEVDPLLVNSIDSVYIYREMGTNNYVLVGGTEYTDEEWSDEVNSIAHAWKYKISLVGDPCGESVSSSSVQTIHSWVSEFGGNYTIQWDPYVVDAKTTVTWYKILSGNELNTLTVRDSVSGSLHSVTLPSTTDSIFVVGAELNGAKSFNGLALSNKTPNPTVTRVTTKTIAPIFLIYPNPASETINIISDQAINEITVYSITGQEMLKLNNTKTVDVSGLAAGSYSLRIVTESGVFVESVVVE